MLNERAAYSREKRLKCGNEICVQILVMNLRINFGDLTLFGESMQHQKRISGFVCVSFFGGGGVGVPSIQGIFD